MIIKNKNMEQKNEEIEKYLLKNKRQILMAITHLSSFHGRAVSKKTKINEVTLDNVFAKLILPLQISLFEIELNIIINKHNALFMPLISSSGFSKKPLTERWIKVLLFLFEEKYLKGKGKIMDEVSIGNTNFHRYNTLRNLISKELDSFIELRNRLAHGQWGIAFNNDALIKNQDLTTAAWTLSKKETMVINAFANNLPILFKLLSTSKSAFESSYDLYIGKIQRAIKDANIKYLQFVNRKR
jgi:hypothetical protein